jgi:DNA-binding NtrC family response regulator
VQAENAQYVGAVGFHAYMPSPEQPPISVGTWLSTQPKQAELELLAAGRIVAGRLGLSEAQRLLRHGMVREALASQKGNRHAAARLLQVSRRYVLKLLAEYPELYDLHAQQGSGCG